MFAATKDCDDTSEDRLSQIKDCLLNLETEGNLETLLQLIQKLTDSEREDTREPSHFEDVAYQRGCIMSEYSQSRTPIAYLISRPLKVQDSQETEFEKYKPYLNRAIREGVLPSYRTRDEIEAQFETAKPRTREAILIELHAALSGLEFQHYEHPAERVSTIRPPTPTPS